MTIHSIPVFEWPIDWMASVNGRWQFDLRDFALGFGPELTDIQQDHIVHGFDFTCDFRGDEIGAIDDFLDALQGRAKPFWMPGPEAKFHVFDGNTLGSFKIFEQGAASGWQLHPGAYLWLTKSGETAQLGRIASVSDNGDGTETVTLTANLATTIDDSWQVFPLYLVRLADDTERVEVCAEGHQRRTFRVVELPNEYATTEASGESVEANAPVYLYKFVAGDQDWRFTSHSEDVIIQDATWLAVGIEHSRLSRSVKLGGTVTITADVDTVEPLRLLVPPRLAAPLKIILSKTSVGLEEPEVLFNGSVRKPDLAGRKISVQCVEWGEVLEQRIPNFYIQRNCNYRLYDPHTCKASKPDRTISMDVISKSGRTIVAEDVLFGLLYTPENIYALGTVELGEGTAKEVYNVLASTAAQDNKVTLTLNREFQPEVPIPALLIHGCDGRRSTCIELHNNLANFGGHATPRDNLTLTAIKTNARGGKK